jgi:cell division protein FtsB
MVVRRNIGRWRRRLLVGALAFSAIGYFGWHAFHGNYGIFAKEQLEARVAAQLVELEDVRSQRKALERRVALLKAQSLDPDILEERARESLGLSHPNDVVVLQAPPQAPAPAQPQRVTPRERR